MTQHHTGFLSRRALLVAAVAPLTVRQARAGRTRVRVGWLGWAGVRGATAPTLALTAFRSGLAERGWVEGENLELLVRDGDRSRSAELAVELIQLGVDVLVAQGPMVFGARTVSGSKPLVFNIMGDPVEAGLVASLSRPGGSLTGVTALSEELAGKRMELLGEAMRRRTRVAVIANDKHPGFNTERRAALAAAQRLGLTLNWYPLRAPTDLDSALAAMARDGADGLLAIPDNLIFSQARSLAEFVTARRWPSISGSSEFVEAGNLMSYGPSPRGYYRQMAAIADRLLRGARAADVAVEQAWALEFVINLRAARAMGLELPAELQIRADRRVD